MADIGVVSIHDVNNVGNRLQSYALCSALDALGHTPTVIPNTPYPYQEDPEFAGAAHSETGDTGVTDEAGTAAGHPESVAATARRLVTSGDWWGLADKARRALVMLLRTRALTEFTHANLRLDSRSITRPGDGQALRDDYDVFVVGSDQVWNPTFRYGCPTDFLRFAHHAQRVAYAASFGISELPGNYAAPYRTMLDGIDKISVRESSGAGLVHELIGREVPVVLDPTMLVPLAQWHQLADRAPDPTGGPFLGTYLLWTGDRATHQAIRSLARSRGLRTRELMAPGAHRPEFYGVENFLRTIRDAEFVVTDSFHSTLFALLFRTPVRVISRGSGQDDRIESLLAHFGIPPSEAFGKAGEVPVKPLVEDPEGALSTLREQSLRWLSDAVAAAATGGGARAPEQR